MKKNKILWVDMDDTICDFMTPFKEDVSRQLESLTNEYYRIKNSSLKLWNVEMTKLSILESLIGKIEAFFEKGIRLNLSDEEKEYFVYPQSQPGFLLNLKPIYGAKENIEKLKEIFDVKILTKPSYLNGHGYTEKWAWIKEHYGIDMCQHLYFAPDKSLLKGDYLVDDLLWVDFEGTQIQFGTEDYPDWETVYNFLSSKYEYC
jgi:hypothetical protein